jgi:hypothetical protein
MDTQMTSMEQLIASLKRLKIHAPGLTSKVGILRLLYREIDATKMEGYEYGTILGELITHGYRQTTRNEFYGLMNRIRLEQGIATPYSPRPSTNPTNSCQTSTYAILSKSESKDSIARPTQIQATVEELKTASRSFDIDPTTFD